MKLHWSEVAEADIDDIYDYIARDVPYYAELFIDRLIEAVDKLENHPEIGRRVPKAEGRNDLRELILQHYRIIYRVDSDSIYIVAVIHGSRDLAGQDMKPWDMT